jgi:hypothetical protein
LSPPSLYICGFVALLFWTRIACCQVSPAPNLSYDDFSSRLAEAKLQQKPVLLFLGSEESAVSKKIDTDILSNPPAGLKKSLESYVIARVNGASPEGRQVENAYGWRQPPLLAVINGEGEFFDMLDLSRMTEQLINSGTADQLTAWLDKNSLRFQRHGARGYGQTDLSKEDPIRSVLEEWEKVKDRYKKSGTLLLLNDARLNFDGKGSIRLRQRLVSYIGKTDSVINYEIQLPIWMKSSTFRLINGRVVTPDLKVNKLDPADIEETGGYLNVPQYNHVHTEKMLFPAVKQGCLVESDWELVYPAQMPGQASFEFPISLTGVSTLHAHAEFSTPASTDPKGVVLWNSGAVTSKTDHGITTLSFDGHSEHNQPDKEPGDRDLPVPEAVVFATKNSWEEIAKWFLSLTQSAECRTHTQEMDEWTATALAGVEKGSGYERRASNAIMKAMRQKFRYLNIQLNDSGYQPHPVAETFRNQCGDCKDLSLFLQEALKHSGVESHLVLLDTNSHDPFEQELSRTYFNHCILRIETPEGPLFADPSFFQGAGVLPLNEYGRKALLCSDQKPEVISLPPLDQKTANHILDVKFKSLTKNPIPAEVSFSYTGTSKSRALGSVRNNWNKMFDKRESPFLKLYFKDFEITESHRENDNFENEPLIVRFNVKISGVVSKSADSVQVKPFFFPITTVACLTGSKAGRMLGPCSWPVRSSIPSPRRSATRFPRDTSRRRLTIFTSTTPISRLTAHARCRPRE